MSSNNFDSAFKSLPFKKLLIEEEKEETEKNLGDEFEEDQQPGASLIIPLNIPLFNDDSTDNK